TARRRLRACPERSRMGQSPYYLVWHSSLITFHFSGDTTATFATLQFRAQIGSRWINNEKKAGHDDDWFNKSFLDYVIRQFQPRKHSGLRHRLARSPRSNWSPESAEVRTLLKAPREDGSRFRADLDYS